jgi:hypothetical protein
MSTWKVPISVIVEAPSESIARLIAATAAAVLSENAMPLRSPHGSALALGATGEPTLID